MLSRTVERLTLRSAHRFVSSLSSTDRGKLVSLVRCRSPAKVQRSLVELWKSKNDGSSVVDTPIPVIISKLCIANFESEVDLALDLVFSAGSQDTSLALLGFLEVLNSVIDRRLSGQLVKAYRHVRYMNGIMDSLMTEKFVRLAARSLNYDAIEYVFSTQAITNQMMIEVAEPLILTSRLDLFASFLTRYLRSDPLPTVAQVFRVIRAIDFGRMRRAETLPDLCRSEVDAINRMYSDLEAYHVRLALAHPHMNVNECVSAQALEGMYENERFVYRRESKYVSPTRLPDTSPIPPYAIPNILQCEMLTEDRAPTDFEAEDGKVLSGLTLRDLTHELVSRDRSAHYLYNSGIFKGQFERECADFSTMALLSGQTDGMNEVHRFKMGTIVVDGVSIPVEAVVVARDTHETGDMAIVGRDQAEDDAWNDLFESSDDDREVHRGHDDDDVDEDNELRAGEDEENDEEEEEEESSDGEYHISLDNDAAHRRHAHHLHFQGQMHYSQVREGLPDLSTQLHQAFPGYFVQFEEAIFEPDDFVPDAFEGSEDDEEIDEDDDEDEDEEVDGTEQKKMDKFMSAESDEEDEWEPVTSKIPLNREYRLQYREYDRGVGSFLDGPNSLPISSGQAVKESAKVPMASSSGPDDSGGGVGLSTRIVNRIQRWLE